MRPHLMAISTAVLVMSSVGAKSPQAEAPAGNCRYFYETGHYVCDEFLDFYQSRGDLEIFGFPLTEAYEDPSIGLLVQYFQQARMEWHPGNADPYKVQLGLLIDELGYEYPPQPEDQVPSSSSVYHRYFPETQHTVSYDFLRFFEENGGIDILGYPRSEFMYEDGYIVQYFQRGRLEWHPATASGPRMRLTKVGELYAEREGLPSAFDRPVPPPRPGDAIAQGALARVLKLSATVRHVTLAPGAEQTVYVYVTNSHQEPIEAVTVSVRVAHGASGLSVELPPTDESGYASAVFLPEPVPPGQKVVIDVVARSGTVASSTQTFYWTTR
jgi:hypothetical protein